jgi:Cft2 family RNA processing exonuclease
MFHWDDGLFLTAPRLGLDVRRRQPRCFVSHAHADHVAAHELAYCTAPTAALYQHRCGERRRVAVMEYRRPMDYGDAQLTAWPAGHCLGSAMLHVQSTSGSLLYTGDFKLGESATAEPIELPCADILVMESTFGKPRYRMPPRSEVVAQFLDLVRSALAAGVTPVVHAYPLGKSQEATRLLTDAGIAVLQHPTIFAVSEIYRRCGVDLGDVRLYEPELSSGRAVVTLPRGARDFRLRGLEQTVSIALTGWAVDSGTKYRWGVDHALPLSDHADFDELLQAVERVGASRVYCTHGPREFVEHLRAVGVNAFPVTGSFQTRMF